ncbi:MAG: Lrp/AsnC family transcriptional regulator [Pseudomonadota bacterium]
MDAIDQKLLRAHQNNPEWSMSELGDVVGLSRASCWKRLKALEDNGYILGKAVLLNQAKLGLNVTVIANIKLEKTTTETLKLFEAAVEDHAQIVTCQAMSGDSDYTLRVVAKSIEDYEVLLRETLANLPAVADIRSSFALKSVKNSTELPV